MNIEEPVVLRPQEAISLDPRRGVGAGQALAEDTVEEMVVCLAAIEAAWVTGEFARLKGLLKNATRLADRAGLPDVVHVAGHAQGALAAMDEVALAAVVARLIRVGETSLATLLEIAYRPS